MDTRTAKNLGRLFVAITTALPEQARELARDVILDVIDNPETSLEDKEFWRVVLGIETVEGRRQALTIVSNTDGDEHLAFPGEYDSRS